MDNGENKQVSIIVLYEDFKTSVANSANEYINKLPAIFMAEFFDKLASEFRGLAQKQLQEEVTRQSEVNKDGE
mgnify:CR=1 FL=1